MKKKVFVLFIALLVSAALFAAGQNEQEKNVGDTTEITVMVPPWAEPSSELLESFTAETGIGVVMNIVGWDDIRNKVAIAAVGETAPADVIEIDWSWTGEFGAANWFEPIELSSEEKEDTLTLGSFTYGNDVIGLPYANDFRLGYYNTADFMKAGYDKAPTQWDEMLEACQKIKAKGIKEYPITFTLSATEAATTSLLWMTLSKYGAFFNDDFSVNKEHVLSALEFVNDLVKKYELIDPANQNMKDIEIYGKLTADATSFMVGPTYFLGRINNPEFSKIVGNARATMVPGTKSIQSASFALPEGVGVSKFSKKKEAALKFVKWYTSPEIQIALYKENGNIPCHASALKKLIDEGLIKDGAVMMEQANYIINPFPGGIPLWYAEMSNVIYNSINKMVQDVLTPEDAFNTINAKVEELRK